MYRKRKAYKWDCERDVGRMASWDARAGLVHRRDAELVFEASPQVAHEGARLLHWKRRRFLPRVAALADPLQTLLDQVAFDRRAAVALRRFPRQIHRVAIELDDFQVLRRVRQICTQAH